MRGSTSAPTARVLDIVELLARPGNERLRFSDVVRELELTQATAHAILKTLSDRGWVTRDPVTKTFALGPALAVVAARTASVRSQVRAATAVARQLAAEFDYAASVVERIDDSLVITAFEGDFESDAGDRIPYTPPFGVAFAAWDSAEEQQAWIDRGASTDRALARRLGEVLAQTRDRGFDIDWTTPALTQAARVVGTLPSDGLPPQVRQIMDRLLVEFTTIGVLSGDDPPGQARPVATIAAPVFDANGRVTLIVAVHPLGPMSLRQITAVGRRLVQLAEPLHVTA